MKKDYPQANARLADVAKCWADGELSHDTWRKERRAIIKDVWTRKKDLENNQLGTLPIKSHKKQSNQTLPNLPVHTLVNHQLGSTAAVFLAEDSEVLQDDVLLLGILLFSMVLTTIFMVYML